VLSIGVLENVFNGCAIVGG